jgi:PadR family transcriptional regulator PadR
VCPLLSRNVASVSQRVDFSPIQAFMIAAMVPWLRMNWPKLSQVVRPIVSPYDSSILILLSHMGKKNDVWQGTLALMILKTLDTLGPLHGYGIARRIEQISGDRLLVNYGTLYPALVKLEQEGAIAAEWGFSDNNRRARFYSLSRSGQALLKREAREWEETTGIIARFFAPKEEIS